MSNRRLSRPIALVAAALVSLSIIPVGAASVASAASRSGNDISWPQCGLAYPAGAAFGIVGVNDGRPFTDNACLTSEYQWARTAGPPGLYMNTANPGPATGAVNWYGQRSPNPACGPANELACGYDFGFAAAQQAYAYANSRVAAGPGHTWWLDVETTNAWSADRAVNLADIAGSIDFLTSRGVVVGIYSTRYQWGRITGGASFPTLPEWVPGAANAAQAATFCNQSRSFGGGPVVVAQYVTQGSDFDYPCPGSGPYLYPTQPPPRAPDLLTGLLQALGLLPKPTGP